MLQSCGRRTVDQQMLPDGKPRNNNGKNGNGCEQKGPDSVAKRWEAMGLERGAGCSRTDPDTWYVMKQLLFGCLPPKVRPAGAKRTAGSTPGRAPARSERAWSGGICMVVRRSC
jgi:hypothetical protein